MLMLSPLNWTLLSTHVVSSQNYGFIKEMSLHMLTQASASLDKFSNRYKAFYVCSCVCTICYGILPNSFWFTWRVANIHEVFRLLYAFGTIP